MSSCLRSFRGNSEAGAKHRVCEGSDWVVLRRWACVKLFEAVLGFSGGWVVGITSKKREGVSLPAEYLMRMVSELLVVVEVVVVGV